MNKRDEKMVEYMLNNSEHDNQKAFLAGWDEALKSQWISVGEKLPKEFEDVFILYNYNGEVRVNVSFYVKGYKWRFGDNDVIAWMPIPSFDNILEANKDVLKRLKDK